MGHEDSVTSLVPAGLSHPKDYTELTAPFLAFGEPLYDIGFPLQYNKKIFAGSLSGVEMMGDIPLIMINISVFPGLSGSPVFDCEGHIAGFVLAHDVRSNMLGLANLYTDAKEVL
jgi:S1-C subfamily serine protease